MIGRGIAIGLLRGSSSSWCVKLQQASSLVFVSVLCVWGFRPPVCAAPSLPTLAWARCHVVPLAVCSTSSYSYLRGGAVVVDSARRRGGNRRKSESQVGIHPSKCFRRRLATSSCSACRTFAVYSSSAVLRAVLVSRVAFRRRSLSNSRRQWRFRVCFVPQRCRPTGPTHGRR